MKDIKDSIETFVNSRVKSPYFGSVFATWLVTNRVLLFGLFHFDESMKLHDKLEWAHEKLSDVPIYGAFHLHGLTWTIVWALIVGALVMIVYNKISAYSKWLYLLINKSSVAFLQKLEPSKYIEISVHAETEKDLSKASDELSKKKSENSILQKQNENLGAEVLKLGTEMLSRQTQIELNSSAMKINQDEIEQFRTEKNRFKINYARYGKYDRFIEVTKMVSESLFKDKELLVNNVTFETDPIRFKVKELQIQYEFNSEPLSVTADEGDNLLFLNNKLIVVPTQESKASQDALERQIRLSQIFNGKWTLNYHNDKINRTELIRIDEMGRYFIEDAYTYDLQATEITDERIVMKKIDLHGELHSIETLNRAGSLKIIGADSQKFSLIYKSQEAFQKVNT